MDLHADTMPIDKKLHYVDVELLLEIANAGVIVVDVNYPDRSATTILAGGSGE